MRLISLYLRSRLAGHAFVLLTSIAAATGLALRFSGGDLFVFGALLFVLPLAASVVIAAGTCLPFGENEQTGSFLLPALRLGHLLVLIAWTVGGFTAAVVLLAPREMAGLTTAGNLVQPGEVAGWLGRNLLGFVGIGFLSARWLGSGRAWITALGHTIMTLTTGPTTIFGWPLRPASEREALVIAIMLLVVGLAAVVRTGACDGRSNGDAG